ncbi:MAG: Fic family protein [Caulobacteraceae bacterium]
MRVPVRPKPFKQLLGEFAGKDPQKLVDLLHRRAIVDAKGRYLHWDELRRKVTNDDLSPDEAWFATRASRFAAAQTIPLTDAEGRPFSYCEPPALRASLRFADLNGGGHLGTDKDGGISQSDGSRYFTRSLAEEPFASSFIEGAATTRQRAKQLIYDQRPPRTRDEMMVLNNYYGMEYVKTIVQEPLTVDAILETHRIITKDSLENQDDAGRLRQSDDVQVVDETSNEILHQPPPFGTLSERLQRICDFANAGDSPENFIHPIVRAIILHFALAYDHPFVDGNGRTARALFYWSALSAGYWLVEYVSISSVIAEAKIAYGQAFLKTETDDGDLTYFLMHQARVLQIAIERLMKYAERRKQEVSAFQAAIDDGGEFNRRQSMLLNDAAKNRVQAITIAEHEKRHKVSKLTARTDLEELVRLGLLRKRKRGRANQYLPAPDLVSKLSARQG